MALVLSGLNFYSVFYTTLFTLCSGFVLISSATKSNGNWNIFSPGEEVKYTWRTSVILTESPKDVKEFRVGGEVLISSVWGDSRGKKLIQLQLLTPKLFVRPKSEIEFEYRSSQLDSFNNGPFVIELENGKIRKLYIDNKEETSLKNLKKGIAGLLQIQFWNADSTETDASGHCNISYIAESHTKKVKSNCVYDDVGNSIHLDQILGTTVISERTTEYKENDSGNMINEIRSEENHVFFSNAMQDLRSSITATQQLIFRKKNECNTIKSTSLEEAVAQLIPNLNLGEETLLTGIEEPNVKKQFNEEVGAIRSSLKVENLGTLQSTKALLYLLEVARASSSEDIAKTLQSTKNEHILHQLYDILGYTQTQNSHKAVMKHLHLDNEETSDLMERYLWALSFSTHPNVEILYDLLHKFKKYTDIPITIRNTLIMTMASMARTLSRSHNQDLESRKVVRTVEETVINGLDYSKDEDRFVFLNALINLQSPASLPKLKSVIHNGTIKEEVLAWKAIKSLDRELWSFDLLKQAEKTFFQLDKKHDTSSRTIAVDILMESGVGDQILEDLLYFVASNDTNYEMRQYTYQNIMMYSERCTNFKNRVQQIIRKNKWLNNWSSLSPRGMSTALTRDIFHRDSLNASLVSVQEIKSGIVKRGAVNVVLDRNGFSKELFTLGIFAKGLSTFISSKSDDDESDEETATAGMELIIMGTQIRPFVFFEGQGELMGHVWSGTASEITPAFQALILAQDHEEYLRLGNGFIVKLDMKGGVSFDLSGKIEISIWSRNAQSLIKKSVAYLLKSSVGIYAPFITAQLNTETTIEPRLSLEIDADFSNGVKLCMRLSQPDTLFRHLITRLESSPGTKHEVKEQVSRKKRISGITYALNRKNSEMCSAIFS